MKLKGELRNDEIEQIVKTELARLFPGYALADVSFPYMGTVRFEVETEPATLAQAETAEAESAKEVA